MCSIEECASRVRCKALCTMHYRRLLRHGDPTFTKRSRKRPTGEVEHGTPHGYNYHRCRCDECATWRREYSRTRRQEFPDEMPTAGRKSWLKKYGLTPESYNEMLVEQGGACAICRQFPEMFARRLHVDHDHGTGRVRALLCHGCNAGLGHFGDDPERLRTAREYLMAHREVRP